MPTVFAYNAGRRVTLDVQIKDETLLFGHVARLFIDELLRDYPRKCVLWLDDDTYVTASEVNALLRRLQFAEEVVELTEEQRQHRCQHRRWLCRAVIWVMRVAALSWMIFALWVFWVVLKHVWET